MPKFMDSDAQDESDQVQDRVLDLVDSDIQRISPRRHRHAGYSRRTPARSTSTHARGWNLS
jgi:hypothetical protein